MKTKLLYLLISLVLIFSIAAAPSNQRSVSLYDEGPSLSSTEINVDDLKVGDIIGKGMLAGSSCDFSKAPVTLRTELSNKNESKWTAIRVDNLCRLVVAGKWLGTMEDGPQDIVEPLVKKIPLLTKSNEVAEGQNILTSFGTDEIGILGANSTANLHVYMYGYGGTPDKLTHLYVDLTIDYNLQTVSIKSASRTCSGSQIFSWYKWMNDSCTRISWTPGPASRVEYGAQGDYHCDPAGTSPCNLSDPDGYYHSLKGWISGTNNGSLACWHSWSGKIVLGTGRIVTNCRDS